MIAQTFGWIERTYLRLAHQGWIRSLSLQGQVGLTYLGRATIELGLFLFLFLSPVLVLEDYQGFWGFETSIEGHLWCLGAQGVLGRGLALLLFLVVLEVVSAGMRRFQDWSGNEEISGAFDLEKTPLGLTGVLTLAPFAILAWGLGWGIFQRGFLGSPSPQEVLWMSVAFAGFSALLARFRGRCLPRLLGFFVLVFVPTETFVQGFLHQSLLSRVAWDLPSLDSKQLKILDQALPEVRWPLWKLQGEWVRGRSGEVEEAFAEARRRLRTKGRQDPEDPTSGDLRKLEARARLYRDFRRATAWVSQARPVHRVYAMLKDRAQFALAVSFFEDVLGPGGEIFEGPLGPRGMALISPDWKLSREVPVEMDELQLLDPREAGEAVLLASLVRMRIREFYGQRAEPSEEAADRARELRWLEPHLADPVWGDLAQDILESPPVRKRNSEHAFRPWADLKPLIQRVVKDEVLSHLELGAL